MDKSWEIKSSKLKINPPAGRDNKKLKIEQIIKVILNNRGLASKKQIDTFLNPPDPYLLTPESVGIQKNQISKSIQRIKKAIINKEHIIVYGDYDADGICATAIMWETLHSLGARVMPFIPNREDIGYGIKKEGIDLIISHQSSAISHQPSLIITVDNGIVANEGVEYANTKGIDVIITDHHQKKVKNPFDFAQGRQKSNVKTTIKNLKLKGIVDLPKAQAIVWSDKVCGAGVAWFFAKELYQHFHKNLLGFKQSNALELACIGTITDLMPVLEINRSLIKYGLQELRRSQRPGIIALCQETGVPQKELDTYQIGYIIGPRLNAMGRLEDALESLRLLCTNDHKKAADLALKLGLTNRRRQKLTMDTFDLAKAKVSAKVQKEKIIIIADKEFNQGVIGLVAGKLMEEFYRPAIVLSLGKEYSKASVRSVKGLNIIETLRKCGDLFEDLGGHPMAAGFTIATKKIKNLELKIKNLLKKELPDNLLQPKVIVDMEIALGDVGWELSDEIDKLKPFGIGNYQPTFISRQVKVIHSRTVGRENKHLKLNLQPTTYNSQPIFSAIAFNHGHISSQLKPDTPIDILYSIEKNVWNGDESLQLVIKDLK